MIEKVKNELPELKFNDFYENYEILKSIGLINSTDSIVSKSSFNISRMFKNFAKSLLSKLEVFRYKSNKPHTVFTIYVPRFNFMFKILSEHFNIVTFQCMNIPVFYTCLRYWGYNYNDRLNKGFINKDLKYAISVKNDIASFFEKKGIDLVILSQDRSFLERAIVFAAKEKNIPVVVYQHGIYFGEDVIKTKIGIYSDEYWVWSQFIKDKFKGAFIGNSTIIRLMGYPFPITKNNDVMTKKVLFIGQPYSSYNNEYEERYDEVAYNTYMVCQTLGLDFFYRPHPCEKKENIIKKFSNLDKFTISEESDLMKDISESRIVVGDISSVMTEAALLRKPVIQIDWGKYVHRQLMDEMYSFTIKTNNTYEDIKGAMFNIVNGKINAKIDDYYMHINNQFNNDIIKWATNLINKQK